MQDVERALRNWINHPLTNKKQQNDLLEKADFIVKDGIFDHHAVFFHIGTDGCYYYKTFFGIGWNKRKPNKDGWIKFLNASAYNVNTGQTERRSLIFKS